MPLIPLPFSNICLFIFYYLFLNITIQFCCYVIFLIFVLFTPHYLLFMFFCFRILPSTFVYYIFRIHWNLWNITRHEVWYQVWYVLHQFTFWSYEKSVTNYKSAQLEYYKFAQVLQIYNKSLQVLQICAQLFAVCNISKSSL